MATDSEVLTELRRATRRDITLSEFEDWFVTMTWDLDSPLLRTVTGLLAEGAGIEGNEAVLDGFERILERPTLVVPLTFSVLLAGPNVSVTSVVTGTAATAVRIRNIDGWPSVIRPAEFQVPA